MDFEYGILLDDQGEPFQLIKRVYNDDWTPWMAVLTVGAKVDGVDITQIAADFAVAAEEAEESE